VWVDASAVGAQGPWFSLDMYLHIHSD
jgi:hypothetical protein